MDYLERSALHRVWAISEGESSHDYVFLTYKYIVLKFFHGVAKESDMTERLHFHFHALEKELATHSSVLAWRIPGTGEPGRLQSMGSRRVGHNWVTSPLLFTFMHWRRKWQPTPVFLPGESQGRGSLVGCRLGVAQSRTRLKWLSSSRIVYYKI